MTPRLRDAQMVNLSLRFMFRLRRTIQGNMARKKSITAAQPDRYLERCCGKGGKTGHTASNVGHRHHVERAYPLGGESRIPNRLHWCTLSKKRYRQKNAEYHHQSNTKPQNVSLPGLGISTPDEVVGGEETHHLALIMRIRKTATVTLAVPIAIAAAGWAQSSQYIALANCSVVRLAACSPRPCTAETCVREAKTIMSSCGE